MELCSSSRILLCELISGAGEDVLFAMKGGGIGTYLGLGFSDGGSTLGVALLAGVGSIGIWKFA